MLFATFEKLDDGAFAGRIPVCQGVVAFGDTLMECQRLLQSTLGDWLLLGLRMGPAMPVLAGHGTAAFVSHLYSEAVTTQKWNLGGWSP